MLGRIAVSEVMHFLGMGSEKMDKEEFYQELLSSQLVSSEIQSRSSKLGIATNIHRAVYCIETDEEMASISREVLGNIFSDNKDDYVTSLEEGVVILIKQADEDDEQHVLLMIFQIRKQFWNAKIGKFDILFLLFFGLFKFRHYFTSLLFEVFSSAASLRIVASAVSSSSSMPSDSCMS